jgi:anaerobic selenocysteine-containing dehydrogenase
VDVILNLAAKAGGAVAEALPWADEALYLEDVSGPLFDSSLSAYGAQSPGEFWSLWRQQGGWWSERELRQEPEPIGFEGQALNTTRASFEGDEQDFPYHLYPYPNIGLSDGRGANIPWLQELADPMTTARWETWVELNPETAHSLGVEDNQVVKIISSHGEIEAVVVVYPGIRPDVIAVPIGQGHRDYGRFAQERGSNPMELLAPLTDPDTGTLAWGATMVRVEPTEETYPLARLESLDGEGRETIR